MTQINIQEVAAIIDRSGSMMGKEDDTLGGINKTFEVLKEERDETTKINVSVKLFDHEETMLFRSIDLEEVRNITREQYQPRGQTALLDAMGNTLTYFMEKKLRNPNAYNSCVIYVVTDGIENASKRFTSKTVKELITSAETSYNIKVLYLGANQDAIMEANKYGINPNQAMNYSETPETVDAAYRACASVARRVSTTGDASFRMAEREASQPYRSVTSPPQVLRHTNTIYQAVTSTLPTPTRQ